MGHQRGEHHQRGGEHEQRGEHHQRGEHEQKGEHQRGPHHGVESSRHGGQEHHQRHGGEGHHQRHGGEGHHEQKQHHGKHGHHQGRHLADLPASVDWRKEGAVTPVKNQGQCGSCWSFSTTGSMEGRWFLKNKTLVSLSEQQCVDCSHNDQNAGCNGGLMDSAFKYAEGTAIETEAQYPYKGRDGTCAAKGGSVEVKSYQDVTVNDPSALAAAVAEGPVSVAIDAGSIFFQLYFGGIMKHFCGTSLDHGVLVVGYGTENGTDYWLLKNSWGASWGESGYFRMLRDMSKQGPGFCGLQKSASYPIF